MPQPTRQKMTRSEAARHAALVRYGKKQALAKPSAANVQARAAEILAKLRAKGQPKPKAAPKGKAKAKPKGKAAKPKETRTPQEKANQNRAAVAKQTGMGDLEGTVVRLGVGMNSDMEKDAHDKLIDKGLAQRAADGSVTLSPAGKKWKAAADKGDAGAAQGALADAQASRANAAAKEKAKGDKQAEREKTKAERATARAAKQAERVKAAQERAKAKQKKSGSGKQKKAAAKPEGTAEDETARIDAAVRNAMKTEQPIMEDQIDQLVGILEYFTGPEIKAGRRNAGGDQALIDQGYALSEELCSLFERLGATVEEDEAEAEADEETDEPEDAAPMDEMPMDGKGIELYGTDLAALPGYAVKATGDGWTSGYLVKFGGDGDLSNWRDVFNKDTDYGRATKSDVWVHHRMLPGVGKRRLSNQADIGIDDEGVFIKHLLDLRSGYEAKLYGLVQAGKLGWSSGTAPHLVDRKAIGDGRHQIEQWPLGLDASYTPTPAGGLVVNAGAMKSLLEDSGVDLLHIIHEASIAETGVKSIDSDSPEAAIVDNDRGDGLKVANERARKLSLQLDILALETAQ
jgi:hypothetical protein